MQQIQPRPNPELIACLKHLLHEAESGQVVEMVGVFLERDGEVLYSRSGMDLDQRTTIRLLGCCELLRDALKGLLDDPEQVTIWEPE